MGRGTLQMLALAMVALSSASVLPAQQDPTAERKVLLSAFGLTGLRFTGLGGGLHVLGGRNASLIAGVNVGVSRFGSYSMTAEGRATYPLCGGEVDAQRSLMAGARVQYLPGLASQAGRVRPYFDVLAGRGALDYQMGGFPASGLLFHRSTSNVYGLGGGFEITVRPKLALVGDAQFEHWNTPVKPGGTIYSKQGSFGLVYRFGAGERPRR